MREVVFRRYKSQFGHNKSGFNKSALKPIVARDTANFHQQTAVNFTNDLGYL